VLQGSLIAITRNALRVAPGDLEIPTRRPTTAAPKPAAKEEKGGPLADRRLV